MILGVGRDQAPRALLAVMAVMVDPRLAEHLPAETLRHFFIGLIPAVVRVGPALGKVEGMGRGPHADHRFARFEVVVDLLHLLVGQVAKPCGDHQQIGRSQGLEAGDVGGGVGTDLTRRRIDGVDHAAVEAVVFGENLRQLREALFAAVFLIATDEHDMLRVAGPLLPFERQPRIGGMGGDTSQHGEKDDRTPCRKDHVEGS